MGYLKKIMNDDSKKLTVVRVFLEEEVHFSLKCMAKLKDVRIEKYASMLLTKKIEEFSDEILKLSKFKGKIENNETKFKNDDIN